MFINISDNSNMEGTNEFFSIIKNFMIDLHTELNQPCLVNPQHIEVIDRAAIQLKTGKENMLTLQNQNAEFHSSRAAVSDYKKQCDHLEKRLNRKTEQIQILKQTVKTLYGDNQKIVKEKQEALKQSLALKEQVNSLKKKIKRQEDEMCNNKIEVQRLSALAEERVNQFLKEDQEKQLRIKKLQSDLQKMKSELSKKQKSAVGTIKRLQELKNIESQNERLQSINQTMKYENGLVKNELELTKQRVHEEKVKYLQQNEVLLKQIEEINQKSAMLASVKQQLELKLQTETEKNQSYEEQIVIRTQKLKEKNKQIKIYNEEIEKLAKRVKQLSGMADDVISENRQLTEKCRVLEGKIEEFKLLYSHVGKLKGEINQRKSAQLGRLIESINKLQASL